MKKFKLFLDLLGIPNLIKLISFQKRKFFHNIWRYGKLSEKFITKYWNTELGSNFFSKEDFLSYLDINNDISISILLKLKNRILRNDNKRLYLYRIANNKKINIKSMMYEGELDWIPCNLTSIYSSILDNDKSLLIIRNFSEKELIDYKNWIIKYPYISIIEGQIMPKSIILNYLYDENINLGVKLSIIRYQPYVIYSFIEIIKYIDNNKNKDEFMSVLMKNSYVLKFSQGVLNYKNSWFISYIISKTCDDVFGYKLYSYKEIINSINSPSNYFVPDVSCSISVNFYKVKVYYKDLIRVNSALKVEILKSFSLLRNNIYKL